MYVLGSPLFTPSPDAYAHQTLQGVHTMRAPSVRRSWMDVLGSPSSTPPQGCPPAVEEGIATDVAAAPLLPEGAASSPASQPNGSMRS